MKKIILLLFLFFTYTLYAQDSMGVLLYGLRPPTEYELKHTPYSAALAPTPIPTGPPVIDLSPNMPPPGVQGKQGSCVGWAVAYALKSYQEKIEHNWNYNTANNQVDLTKVFSPTFLYNTVKFKRFPQPYECLDGISFFEAFKVAIENGNLTLADLAYKSNDSLGCFATNPLLLKPLTTEALNFKISSYERLSFNTPEEFEKYLAQGIPVVIGVNVDQSFEDGGWSAGRRGVKYIWDPIYGTVSKGYHAMVCVGYDRTLREFKVINSWGQNWGSKGYVYIPYDKLMTFMREAYVAYDDVSPSLLTPGNYASESKPVFINEKTFTSWFKPGYYCEYEGIRFGLTYLSKSNDEIIVQFTSLKTNKVIQSIIFKLGESKSFFYNKNKLTFTFNKVAEAGKRHSKLAAFFTLQVEETLRDSKISNLLDQFKLDEEKINLNIKNFQQQQQQFQQQQQMQQLQQQLQD